MKAHPQRQLLVELSCVSYVLINSDDLVARYDLPHETVTTATAHHLTHHHHYGRGTTYTGTTAATTTAEGP